MVGFYEGNASAMKFCDASRLILSIRFSDLGKGFDSFRMKVMVDS
jgi:hypothetical protein